MDRAATTTGALIVVLVVGVSVASADTASIKSVEVVDTTDRDGDGAVSAFNIRITADTNCVGCNDESDDDPNVEPTFYVTLIDEDGDTVELDRSKEVSNADNLVHVFEIPNDILQQYPAQTLEVEVVLFDEDTFVGEQLDKETIRVDIEGPEDDQPQTTTATPTETPTLTATTTPTKMATPTGTPTPTETPTAAETAQPEQPDPEETTEDEGGAAPNDLQDSDGDGVVDSEDYAPNDASVEQKEDLDQELLSEVDPVTLGGAAAAVGVLLVIIARWS